MAISIFIGPPIRPTVPPASRREQGAWQAHPGGHGIRLQVGTVDEIRLFRSGSGHLGPGCFSYGKQARNFWLIPIPWLPKATPAAIGAKAAFAFPLPRTFERPFCQEKAILRHAISGWRTGNAR
ncbi:hypothetical protein Bxe_C0003 [Paraburkholderia xenovorans LB400]|uniref:Uncharacterized protein n=1 Tax=Paraburkholderia xenovorans (strain LB400) TaxID=266265 RepID=Q13J08_PARXL|nr:hypothetical protein Bxe_C0003 [Paraburkholderia xenovorans LB400]